jgi:hypothetical protein
MVESDEKSANSDPAKEKLKTYLLCSIMKLEILYNLRFTIYN